MLRSDEYPDKLFYAVDDVEGQLTEAVRATARVGAILSERKAELKAIICASLDGRPWKDISGTEDYLVEMALVFAYGSVAGGAFDEVMDFHKRRSTET